MNSKYLKKQYSIFIHNLDKLMLQTHVDILGVARQSLKSNASCVENIKKINKIRITISDIIARLARVKSAKIIKDCLDKIEDFKYALDKEQKRIEKFQLLFPLLDPHPTKTDLTVITVAQNDSGLLHYMIYSVFKFTHPTPRIIICDNGQNKDLDTYRDIPYIKIIHNKVISDNTSVRHASGLNKIFPLVKTARTAIVESDCVVLNEKWHEIKKNTMKAVKRGAGKTTDYYHMCFLVFYTDMLKRNGTIDFSPSTPEENIGISIVGSTKKYFDVGWRIGEKVQNPEVELLKAQRCKRKKAKFFFGLGYNKSFEIWNKENIPIAAHFGRGSDLGRRGEYWNSDIRIWFKILYKIFNIK